MGVGVGVRVRLSSSYCGVDVVLDDAKKDRSSSALFDTHFGLVFPFSLLFIRQCP